MNGLDRCWAAFERLKEGKPEVDEHLNLSPSKITKSRVSVEAGFDAGYLKSSRDQHRLLVDEINAFAQEHSNQGTSLFEELKRSKEKLRKAEQDKLEIQDKLYVAITRNMQLVSRVKQLESDIRSLRNVHSIEQL